MTKRDSAKRELSPEEELKRKNIKKKRLNYLISFLFMIFLMGGTFYVIFKDNSMEKGLKLLREAELPWIVGGVLAMLGYIFTNGLTFGLGAKCLGISLRHREMMQYAFAGFLFSAITPSSTGGQPMQFYYMCRDKISPSDTTLIIFLSNVAYQLSAVALGIAMLLIKFRYITAQSVAIFPLFIFGVVCSFVFLAALFGVVLSEKLLIRVLAWGIRLLGRMRIIKDIGAAVDYVDNYLSEVRNGLALMRSHRGDFLKILLVSFVMHFCYQSVPFFAFKAFGMSGHSIFTFFAINMVLFQAVSFLPLPGMVGAAESGFMRLFVPIFGAALLPGMLLSRFISFYFMLLVSGVVCAFIQLRKPYDISRRKRDEVA